MANHAKLSQSVIDKKQLDQQRRTAKHQNVTFGNTAEQRPAAHAQRQNPHRQYAAAEKGADKQPQRDRQRGTELEEGIAEKGNVDKHKFSLSLSRGTAQPGAIQAKFRPNKRPVGHQGEYQVAAAANHIEQEVFAGGASGDLAGAH